MDFYGPIEGNIPVIVLPGLQLMFSGTRCHLRTMKVVVKQYLQMLVLFQFSEINIFVWVIVQHDLYLILLKYLFHIYHESCEWHYQ